MQEVFFEISRRKIICFVRHAKGILFEKFWFRLTFAKILMIFKASTRGGEKIDFRSEEFFFQIVNNIGLGLVA